MSIKIAVLKSGEDIVADIQEMIVGDPDSNDRKVIGYFFNNPCVVNLSKNQETESIQITLSPWIPITKTTKIPVVVDWVVTIVDPIEQIEKMYVNDVLKEVENSKKPTGEKKENGREKSDKITNFIK